MTRPDRRTLEGMIRQSAGNLTRLSALLNISRPTLYKWIYQLGLDGVAGVASVYGVYSGEQENMDATSHKDTKKHVNPAGRAASTLALVSSMPADMIDPRVNTSVRIRQSVWKRLRKAAIDGGVNVSELLERAAEELLDRAEQPKRKGKAAE